MQSSARSIAYTGDDLCLFDCLIRLFDSGNFPDTTDAILAGEDIVNAAVE